MWGHMARIVGEVRPQYVFVENSPMLTSRGLGVVLGDLAEMGYDAQWGCISAREAGAPHSRERIWIVAADSTQIRRWNPNQIQKTSNAESNIWDARQFNALLGDCKSWNDTERAIDILGDGLGEVIHILDKGLNIAHGDGSRQGEKAPGDTDQHIAKVAHKVHQGHHDPA